MSLINMLIATYAPEDHYIKVDAGPSPKKEISCDKFITKDEFLELKDFIIEQNNKSIEKICKGKLVTIEKACDCFCKSNCNWCSYKLEKKYCNKLQEFKKTLINNETRD